MPTSNRAGCGAGPGHAGRSQQQQDFSAVEVKAEKVAEGLYMLTGRGGNIGLSVGKSGAFLSDDQYAPLSDKILAAVKAITPHPCSIRCRSPKDRGCAAASAYLTGRWSDRR